MRLWLWAEELKKAKSASRRRRDGGRGVADAPATTGGGADGAAVGLASGSPSTALLERLGLISFAAMLSTVPDDQFALPAGRYRREGAAGLAAASS